MVRSRPGDPTRSLVSDGWCFVCGKENPSGLQLSWSRDADGVARARFHPERRHQGWKEVVHGGILAALLDEAMAQCAGLGGTPAVTASLQIRYRRPAPIGEGLIAEARIEEERGRVLVLTAAVRNEGDGTCYAEARGTCVKPRAEGDEA